MSIESENAISKMFDQIQMVIQLIILVVAIAGFTAKGLSSECSAINNGTYGRVECVFSIDIQKANASFSIKRYDFGADTPDDVLYCMWTIVGRKCKVAASYHFDNIVSSKVVVSIPNITKKHEGKYYCYEIPSEDGQVQNCELKITDVRDSQQPIESRTTISTGKASENPSDNTFQAQSFVIGILSVFPVAFIIAAVVLHCLFRKGIIICRGAEEQNRGSANGAETSTPARQTNGINDNPLPAGSPNVNEQEDGKEDQSLLRPAQGDLDKDNLPEQGETDKVPETDG